MTMTTAATPTTDDAVDQALALAAIGLRVVPIKPSGVHPPMNSWQHAATNDTRVITNWFRGLYRNHGLGVAMGPQPGGYNLIAIDVDVHEGAPNGYDSLHELEQEHGALPDTWRSLSGGGGTHILLRAPSNVVVRNQQAGGSRIAPGIDVRGAGGQIVVAPSLHHRSGRQYAWEHGYAPWEHELADCPAWLLERVREPELPAPPVKPIDLHPSSNGDSIAESVREWWDWQHELEARGWTLTRRHGADGYWTRPGKNPRDGHSAVLHGDTHLVVFTTEIPDDWRRAGIRTADGSGYSFSPFAFLAACEYGGDRTEAARALRLAQQRHPTAGLLAVGNGAPTATQVPISEDPDAELRAMLIHWPAFWAQDHADAEWLAEPLLAAKRSTALFAPGGTGKSLLALWLAAHLAAGVDPFSGRRIVPIDVLYLDYEMTEADLSERLEQMGFADVDLDHLHYALLPSLPGLDEPEGGRAVVRLAQLCDAQLVIIDTFGRAVHGDENDADTVRAWYRWTGLHLKHEGRAFLRVDHAGKDLTKGQRGTSAKNDDVDVVWQMTVREGGFALHAKKRRMGWVPLKVEITMTDEPLAFQLVAGEQWPAGTKEAAEALDGLEVDADAGWRAAGKAIRASGQRVSNEVVRAAQKYRRLRSDVFHFADDEPVDKPAKCSPAENKGGPDEFRPTPPDQQPGPPSGPPGEDDLFAQVDEFRPTSRPAPAHPTPQERPPGPLLERPRAERDAKPKISNPFMEDE